MTTPSAVSRPVGVRPRLRLAARVAVSLAGVLAPLPPRYIESALAVARRGAAPASYRQARDARNAVLAVSLSCAGPQGCLRRSVATALLCRMSGRWPTWCVGVRMLPPFGAHAWVEAEGRLVDEEVPGTYFSRLMVLAPEDQPRS